MKTGKRILSLLLAAALLLSTSAAVFAEAVVFIEISALPKKLTYYEWESLDMTGAELLVNYSDDFLEDIPITEDMVTGFDSTVLGTQTLTVSYAGLTCTFDVLVTPKPASAISVTTLPAKLTYLEDKDTLDVTGGELTVSYADGTPDRIFPMTLDMVTGFDNTSVGAQTLTVTYAGQTTTYQVEIRAKTLAELTLAQTPTKTTYLLGEEALDITGGQIRLLYNNDTSELVDMTADMVSGFDGNTAGVQTITVAYRGLTTTYQIEVFETKVVSISVAKLPNLTRYLLNVDNLDVGGGEITVSYENGTTANIPMTDEMISGFDNTVLGEQALTVTYAGETAEFTVEICQENTTEFFGGLGTVNHPYLIKTKEHLDHVRDYLDAHYMMSADIEFTEADFAEDGAFYHDGAGWQPIGTSSAPFNGYFDGNGHAVIGLQINITADGTLYAGLFGYAKNCTIRDLGMVDSSIKATSTSISSSYAYAGGIAGYASGAAIRGCRNMGSITALSNGSSYAGGIAGYANNTNITTCCNTGSVTASRKTGSYKAYAGGIAGYVNNVTIAICYNTGCVTAIAKDNSKYGSCYAYAGGIAGYADGSTTVTNCYNTDSVTTVATTGYPNAAYDYAGGIVGYARYNAITKCYSTGSLSSMDYAGGIAGQIGSTITNCYYLDIINQGVGGGKTAATACTEEQMKKQATFSGFNFNTVWTMDAAAAYSLPTLREFAHVETADTVNFAGGSGSLGSPYQIATKEQLNNVRNHSGHFKLIADIVFTEADFAEGGAFYNGGAGWQPIGTSSEPFNDYFDGNGHAVIGLQINITAGSTVYAGLFGYAKECRIRNLGMEDSCIEVTSGSSNAYAGGIVGYVQYGATTIITNCYNTGSVTSNSVAGGIVGRAKDSAITDCCNTGSVTSNSSVGGIVAIAYDTAITNCCNTGSVTATSDSSGADAGGIAGASDGIGSITDCCNTGSVTATSDSSGANAGGIVGYARGGTGSNGILIIDATVTRCSNRGSVTATSDSSGADAGGIAGEATDSTVTDCYNTGSVTATSGSYRAYAGGIVGNTDSTDITNCYNTGSVTATSGSSDAYAGGIAGDTYSSGSSTTNAVTNCYNTGSVTATSDSSSAYAGGIVGYAGYSTITNGYNTGSVTAGSDSPYVYAGGIAGDVFFRNITNCYYLNIIGKGVGRGTDTATACTIEQMKQQETFAGFDFETVWTMEGHEDFLFPELQTVPMVFTDRLVDVSIDTLPDKLTFLVGAPLDVSGGMLKVSYLGGKVLEVPMVDSMVTGFDNSVFGEQILTVTYAGITTTYTVTVTHSFGAWVLTEEPTCTDKGEERRDCSLCGYYETREVEALGHDYKDTVTDPTCTEGGYTTFTCSVCGDVY
ncbi:MAG: bacterial Ig-like domain-containing protein, partial [Faecousia sp.]